MATASKEKMSLPRAEAVQRLHGLAEQLSQGTVRLGGKAFQVPEQVRIEIRAEKDELDIELKWRPSAA